MAKKCETCGQRVPTKKELKKASSRPARWADAVARGQAARDELNEAIEELRDLQGEYQDWLDNLPENLQQSALGEKLETVANIDLEAVECDGLEEAQDADLPRGFGND